MAEIAPPMPKIDVPAPKPVPERVIKPATPMPDKNQNAPLETDANTPENPNEQPARQSNVDDDTKAQRVAMINEQSDMVQSGEKSPRDAIDDIQKQLGETP